MKKHLIALCIAFLPLVGIGQDNSLRTAGNGTVTLASPGNDVRMIFHNLFVQANKSYVLEPYTYHQLHWNLENVEFEDALQIIYKLGQLKYEVQNGIYFISRDKNGKSSDSLFADRATTPLKKGTLPKNELDKNITTRLQKTDIREVFADFAKQTQLTIEVNSNVPAYKIDA